MKTWSKWLAACVAATALVACGEGQKTAEAPAKEQPKTAEAPAADTGDRSNWPSSLSIGTASQGGVYFVYGNGLAGFIGEALGVSASGAVTGGPVQNATLVQSKEQDLGLVTMGPMLDAWNGKSVLAPGLEHKDVRALFAMYETPMQAITMRSSGITKLSDLNGKRVSVGPAGGTGDMYWRRILEVLKIDATISNAGASDSAGQLKDGMIDAFLFAAGVPTGAFSQLSAEADVITFSFSEDELANVLKSFPEVAAYTIPANTYSVQKEDLKTVAMWNFVVVNKDMPESLAYEITKLALENNPRMVQIHATAKATVPENWNKNTFLPFHPGAARYYDEKGIQIPDNLK